jgi:aerobic-type carbon monoxide dehydrogenase small subunit (CoxS/CutS family)
MSRSQEERGSLSRRAFLKGAGGAAAAGTALGAMRAAAGQDTDQRIAGATEIELSINGAKQKLTVEPRTTLLNALRNHCQPPLTGTKLVCDTGSCGACTVFVDGRPQYACMRLAADCAGREITTIEGLSRDGELTPVQRAFVDCDASMCGFCTPGFVMSVTACLAHNPRASLDEIKRACSGNLCRCGTYPHVFQAALSAQRESAGGR